MLVDRFNRKINYLRISLTDRCNLRCQYCMPLEGEKVLRHKEILRYEELLRIVRIAVKLGITKIRLTGGEPLIRRGIREFIPMLMSIKGLDDVSLTTNCVYLKDNLKMLKKAGIKVTWFEFKHPVYPQIRGGFIGHLSVLDLLFNTGEEAIKYIRGIH